MTSTHNNEIKSTLKLEEAVIRNAHFAGANGGEVVLRRTNLIDRTLRLLHDRLSAADRLPALLATGGYGRGELNPYSDIDIMFLCRDEPDRQRSLELLYILWDAGMDVGYSVRTIPECVSLARQDIKIRTSLLESRLIAGDPVFYESFISTMRSEVFFLKPSAFINEKISDRLATRRKYGGSIYLREPNIKECEGGLRDIHTAFWIAFVHFRVPSLGDLIEKSIITAGQYSVFLRSRNFLWRVRNEVHYLSGRKNDHLTFDLQEQSAKDFKYRDSADLFAVERFMKSYFLHARNIREFSNTVSDAILKKSSRTWFERTLKLGPFALKGRTLFPSSPESPRVDPLLAMTAFGIAQSRHAMFSDHLRNRIRTCRVDDSARTSQEVSRIFLAMLNNPDALSETLVLMKDLRFLGKYLPEFRSIQALARHDYYHLYTVDEHILLAIKNLQALWSGNFPSLNTLSDAFRAISKKWVLFLAVLLHDLGKAFRDRHEYKGAELAMHILVRLDVKGEDSDRILFLIENHLIMTSLSQRRELGDRKVIAGFSRLVRDRENLAMLYLLTYADISAVSPTSWTQWKAALLQDLYVRTLRHLDASAQTGEEDQARVKAASLKIKHAAAGRFTEEEIDALLASMPAQYLLTTSSQRVMEHLGMIKKLPAEKLVIRYRHYPERGYTELTVCAYDAYGMFYRTAGTIASQNLNILRAQVFTSKNGVMIDTFQITGPDGTFFDYKDAWESVRTELRSALMHGIKLPEPSPYTQRQTLPASITPTVAFDNESSDIFTIIDITARDSIGFLYRVTKVLYDLNLDIGSAKIVTEGSRVLDSFYVTDLFKKKIDDAVRLDKIRETLIKVIL